MNLIDKAIEYISPQAAFKRQAYRNALIESRSYDAAGYGRHNNNWNVWNEPGELTDRYDREIVRARARDLERNSDVMNAVINAYTRNVFGKGYRLRATTGDKAIDDALERGWQTWCKAKNCDITGQQSFNAIMRMAVRRKKVDGGIFFLKVVTDGGYLPFKLQLLEVDELDESAFETHGDGRKVVGGIEYNTFNRPIGYNFKRFDVTGTEYRETVYVEAQHVIFYFSKTRPSQVREISDMAKTITRTRNINEFLSAQAIKERILACFSVFIKQQFPQAGMGFRDSKVKDSGRYDYQGKTVTPGLIQYLNPGDEVQAVNPAGQATDANQFTKLQLQMVSAGQGLSYESISRDLSNANYSSARQGAIEDEQTFTEDVEGLMEIMDEIYETFVIYMVLEGRVNIPNFWADRYPWFSHRWVKPPKKWIDPLKEASANKIALQTGQKTWAEQAAENGRDWREQVDEIADVIEYGKAKGVNMEAMIYGIQGNTGTGQAGSTETDDARPTKPES